MKNTSTNAKNNSENLYNVISSNPNIYENIKDNKSIFTYR